MSTTNWNPTRMYHFQLMKISTQESNAILIDQSLFNTWAKKEDFRGGGGGNSHSFQREKRVGSQSLPNWVMSELWIKEWIWFNQLS